MKRYFTSDAGKVEFALKELGTIFEERLETFLLGRGFTEIIPTESFQDLITHGEFMPAKRSGAV